MNKYFVHLAFQVHEHLNKRILSANFSGIFIADTVEQAVEKAKEVLPKNVSGVSGVYIVNVHFIEHTEKVN